MLEEDFHHDLLDIKDTIKLDRIILGYYDRCLILNEILSKHNFLLKFSRENTSLGLLSGKEYQGKMKWLETSQAITGKFNGCKYIEPKLACKEKIDFTAIDIVYKPVYNENFPFLVFLQVKSS